MPVATFSKSGATTYTFAKGTFLPFKTPEKPNQIVGIAGGNQVKVADLGTAENFYYINLLRVSSTNRNALLTFLRDSNVNYSENTFTYTDESSVATTVRLWMWSGFDFPQVKGGLYNIKLILRKEIT